MVRKGGVSLRIWQERAGHIIYFSIPPEENPSRNGLRHMALFKPGGEVAFNK